MGLGGHLAARSDVEHYDNERETEQREVEMIPAKEIEEVEINLWPRKKAEYTHSKGFE
jgi:hypothetical protein